jgi:hypothetical protein
MERFEISCDGLRPALGGVLLSYFRCRKIIICVFRRLQRAKDREKLMIPYSPKQFVCVEEITLLDCRTHPAPSRERDRPGKADHADQPEVKAAWGKCSKCNCGGFQGGGDYCPCGHSFGDHWGG